MARKLSLYNYGDIGSFDELNPMYIFGKEHVPEILFLIADLTPYTLTDDSISELLGITEETAGHLTTKLVDLGMISESDGKYSIDFTTILEKDLPLLEGFSDGVAERISNIIDGIKEQIQSLCISISQTSKFGPGRILYHAIGCNLFDRTALDILTEIRIIDTSKMQSGGRNYILYGFEDCESVDRLSEDLLCSGNNVSS